MKTYQYEIEGPYCDGCTGCIKTMLECYADFEKNSDQDPLFTSISITTPIEKKCTLKVTSFYPIDVIDQATRQVVIEDLEHRIIPFRDISTDNQGGGSLNTLSTSLYLKTKIRKQKRPGILETMGCMNQLFHSRMTKMIATLPGIAFQVLVRTKTIQPPFSLYQSLLTGAIAFLFMIYSGWDHIKGFKREVKLFPKLFHLGMSSLVTINCLIAFAFSMVIFIGPFDSEAEEGGYFSAIFLSLLTLHVSSFLKDVFKKGTGKQRTKLLKQLKNLQPKNAKRILDKKGSNPDKGEEDAIEFVETHQIRNNDRLIVTKDECIPVDCVYIDGKDTIEVFDSGVVYGEKTKKKIKPGDKIFSGTRYLSEGSITVKALCDGDQSALHELINNIECVYTKLETPFITVVNRVAGVFTYAVLAAGLATLLGWGFANKTWWPAIKRMMTVLFGLCPCTIATIPDYVQLFAYLFMYNKHKILINNFSQLEVFSNIGRNTCFVFDKTGTLTKLECCTDSIKDDPMLKNILGVVATIETVAGNKHPAANAIIEAAKKLNIRYDCSVAILKREDEKKYTIQSGISGVLNGKLYTIGNEAYVCERHPSLVIDNRIGGEADLIPVYVVEGEHGVGALILTVFLKQRLRKEAKSVLTWLYRKNVDCYILSGSKKESVLDVARQLKIPQRHCFFEKGAQEKKKMIDKIQLNYENICYVGDGANDILATANATVKSTANVGFLLRVAISNGVPFSSVSQVTLNDDLLGIKRMIDVPNQLKKNLKISFGIAVGLNIMVMLLNGFLIPFLKEWHLIDFEMSPEISAIWMALSSFVMMCMTWFITCLQHSCCDATSLEKRDIHPNQSLKNITSVKNYTTFSSQKNISVQVEDAGIIDENGPNDVVTYI